MSKIINLYTLIQLFVLIVLINLWLNIFEYTKIHKLNQQIVQLEQWPTEVNKQITESNIQILALKTMIDINRGQIDVMDKDIDRLNTDMNTIFDVVEKHRILLLDIGEYLLK